MILIANRSYKERQIRYRRQMSLFKTGYISLDSLDVPEYCLSLYRVFRSSDVPGKYACCSRWERDRQWEHLMIVGAISRTPTIRAWIINCSKLYSHLPTYGDLGNRWSSWKGGWVRSLGQSSLVPRCNHIKKSPVKYKKKNKGNLGLMWSSNMKAV